MKQLILVSGVLALVLGACGKEEATTVTPVQQEAAPVAAVPAAPAPTPAAPAATPAPTAAPAPAPTAKEAPTAAPAPAPTAKEATPAAPATTPAVAGDAMEAGKALAKQSGCLACHNIEQKRVGPSWNDVAMKYKGDAAARDSLIKWIHSGGTGRWQMGTMPAYSPRVSDADIEKLTDFILSLAK